MTTNFQLKSLQRTQYVCFALGLVATGLVAYNGAVNILLYQKPLWPAEIGWLLLAASLALWIVVGILAIKITAKLKEQKP